MESFLVRGRGASFGSLAAITLAASTLLAACGHGSNLTSNVLPSAPLQSQSSGLRPDVAPTIVYAGGAGIPAKAFRQWFDYYGIALPPDPQGAPNGLPVNPNAQYYYDSDGAGNGLIAFLSQVPDGSAPSVPPYPCPNQVITCLPYPEWDLSANDGALTPAQITCYQVGGPCGAGGANIGPAQPARGQYVQIPALETDLTLPYNPNGQTVSSNGLHLSRNSYCGMWEGAITNWGDPGITADNGGVQVSTQNITLIVRSDGAGATLLLTQHLNTACQSLTNPNYDWTRGVGTSGINWPTNSSAFKGNGGIVSGVTNTPGAIGYVGPSYVAPVVPGGLPTALLQNHFNYAGSHLVFTAQSVASTLAAFKGLVPQQGSDPFDLGVDVPDPAQKTAYPIVGFVYVEAYQCYQTAGTANSIGKLVKWYSLTSAGATPADQVLNAQGFAALTNKFKIADRKISSHIVKGPINGTCTI